MVNKGAQPDFVDEIPLSNAASGRTTEATLRGEVRGDQTSLTIVGLDLSSFADVVGPERAAAHRERVLGLGEHSSLSFRDKLLGRLGLRTFA
jgi:hypothetical protein